MKYLPWIAGAAAVGLAARSASNLPPVRFGYIVADGAIWKFNRAELARLVAGEYFADIKSPMATPAYNYRTSTWRNLPAALGHFPGDGSDEVYSTDNRHEVGPRMDDADLHPEWAAEILRQGQRGARFR